MANTTGKKYGGRQKGTPNKVTKEVRQVLKAFCDKELDNLPYYMKKIDIYQRLDILVKLLPYVIPKMESGFDLDLREINIQVDIPEHIKAEAKITSESICKLKNLY